MGMKSLRFHYEPENETEKDASGEPTFAFVLGMCLLVGSSICITVLVSVRFGLFDAVMQMLK